MRKTSTKASGRYTCTYRWNGTEWLLTIMGVAAISHRGLMEVEPAVVQAQNRLMELSDELIVLADSSKFSRKASLILCPLNRIGRVITDTGAPDAAVQMLEHAGVKVIVVEPERDFASLH